MNFPHLTFLLDLIVVACLTYFLHECAHGLAYFYFEIDFDLKLNTIVLQKDDLFLTQFQKSVIYGSGVGFTFLQGVTGFLLVKKDSSNFGFLLLLSAAIFRWAAALQGIWTSSDEIQMSIAMGLPTTFWHLLVSLSFLIMVIYTKRKMAVSNQKLFGVSSLFLLVTYLFSLI